MSRAAIERDLARVGVLGSLKSWSRDELEANWLRLCGISSERPLGATAIADGDQSQVSVITTDGLIHLKTFEDCERFLATHPAVA
jgi:hypothetical protein